MPGRARAGDRSHARIDGGRIEAGHGRRRDLDEPGAWARFERLPASYKRIRLGFIEGARGRPETFAARLRYFVRMTAQGNRFGMVRS